MDRLPPTGAGAGRGKQGGPTAAEMNYRNSEAYVSPADQEAMKNAAEDAKYSAENKSQKIMKRGGTVKKMAKGGSVSSASKRADGCAERGLTKGKYL
jgi:hypothetical protein